MNIIKILSLIVLLGNSGKLLYPMFGALNTYFWPSHAAMELFESLQNNDQCSVLKILNSGIDIKNCKNEKGLTLGQYALRENGIKLDTIRILDNFGGICDFKDDENQKLALIHIINTNPQGFN